MAFFSLAKNGCSLHLSSSFIWPQVNIFGIFFMVENKIQDHNMHEKMWNFYEFSVVIVKARFQALLLLCFLVLRFVTGV